MTHVDSSPRPAGVTVVVVLTYLSGILGLLGGLLEILVSRNSSVQAQLGAGSGVIVASGVVSIVVGLVTILVARGLRHARRAARLTITVVMAVQIAASLAVLLIGTSQPLSPIVQIVVSALVIFLLWSGAAKSYFRH